MPSDSTVFGDTNVFLYAQDPRAPEKRDACAAWIAWCWKAQRGRLSSQVLHELYANLRRVAPTLDKQVARDVVRRYRAWSAWLVDDAGVELAWQLQDRFVLGYWDALMVAAALHQGCTYLLTEDLQHEQQIDRVQVLSPFLVGPDVLEATPR